MVDNNTEGGFPMLSPNGSSESDEKYRSMFANLKVKCGPHVTPVQGQGMAHKGDGELNIANLMEQITEGSTVIKQRLENLDSES